MVYYSPAADTDLAKIFIGLSTWQKHALEYEHVAKYVDDIIDVCDLLDKLTYHSKTTYVDHKKHGEIVYKYSQNKATTWYIIYDYNQYQKVIYIQHITSNYSTQN